MDTKSAARERFESARKGLIDLSHRIHAHPELGFEEEKSSTWLCESLADAGFSVDKGICDLPTAFRARAGSGPLHIGICAEYDSLPGIGHACGHNVIAASAVGAALAAAKVADEVGLTISVIGTPAEEVGNAGGKILLLERGGFKGIHASMMVHPAPFDMLRSKIIAASMFEVHYTGKESHASAFPELGINAADALTVAQTALGLLRQHIRSTDRIHGIVTNGGAAPNVVPAHTSAKYIISLRNAGSAGRTATQGLPVLRGGSPRHGLKDDHHGRRQALRRNAPRRRHGDLLPQELRGSGAALPESGRMGDPADRLDGHGKCLARDAVDPPHDRDQFVTCGQSPAGIRGTLRHPGRG